MKTQFGIQSLILVLLFSLATVITLTTTAQAQEAQDTRVTNSPDDTSMLQELEQDAMELRQAILTATEDERAAVAEQASEVMTKFDRRISTLSAEINEQSDEMSAAAQEYSEELMVSLRSQREDVANWMGDLRDSGSETWDHVVYQFSNAYDAFYESWEDVEASFGNN
ncbi:MAG: hypothetical protein RKH07_03950 [Gammaproteobacteria bacterium]